MLNRERKKFDFLSGIGYLIPLLLLLAYDVFAWQIDKSYFYPRVSDIFIVLRDFTKDIDSYGSILRNTSISLLRVLFGFSLAFIIAVPMGLLMGSIQSIRKLLEPLVELFRPLCPIAWMPFVIAVFKMNSLGDILGTDKLLLNTVMVGNIVIIFIGAFFPLWTNTIHGTINVPQKYLQLGKSLGANYWQEFFKIRFPAALPRIINGIRQGIGISWFVIIAAELIPGTDGGIGYLLLEKADLFELDYVIACLIVIAIIGTLLNLIVTLCLNRFIRWYGRES